MTAVAVLGAGAWGTALADHLARHGARVVLWSYEGAVAREINTGHRNDVYLPGHPLSPELRATDEAVGAVLGAEVLVNASPSHTVRGVLAPLAAQVPAGATVVNATKGMETDRLAFMSQVIGEALPGRPYAVLSGPSFAEEVARGEPTAVVAASAANGAARAVQRLFSTPRFRVYTSDDVIGTEVGGSLKNVIAIAAGVLDGLGMGHNPRAALITRGLAEITRLGVALGADPRTFAGLAGVGDLVLTATGGLSRNRSLGVALGRGETLASYRASHPSAVEGVNTARAALRLAERLGVELPIAAQVAAVLFDGKPPALAVADLMERTLKSEHW